MHLLHRIYRRFPLFAYSLAFGLTYTLFTLILTLIFRQGGFLEEQRIYDEIQRNNTIDFVADSVKLPGIMPLLNEITLIDVDTGLIDRETDRIDRVKLATFIKRYQSYIQQSKVLFIDYDFTTPFKGDTLLKEAMEGVKEKLILPYLFSIEGDMAFRGSQSQWTKERLIPEKPLLFSPIDSGYLTPIIDDQEQIYRFFKYKADDDSFLSIPYHLCARVKGEAFAQQQVAAFNNEIVDIRFILRNRPAAGKEPACQYYHISDFIGEYGIPQKNLQEMFVNKVVFIGMFNEYRTKYNLAIDQFPTPVDHHLSGALIIVNAYLGLLTGTVIRSSIWWSILFLLVMNFFAGAIMGRVYSINEEKGWKFFKSLFAFGINLFVVFLIFKYVPGLLLDVWNHKLPIGTSIVSGSFIYMCHTSFKYFFDKKISKLSTSNEQGKLKINK